LLIFMLCHCDERERKEHVKNHNVVKNERK
jgi:hypothetical protein